jgi:nucleoside phosphorylase
LNHHPLTQTDAKYSSKPIIGLHYLLLIVATIFALTMPAQLPGPDEYTVGLICALAIELAAAIQMMDEEIDECPNLRQDPSDTNSYSFGRVGGHNVVATCLPRIGTNAAATVAAQMRSTFRSMQFGLMVGIGGGVPSAADIRLGDVVVSQPVGNHGGVVQYDFGKKEADGQLRRMGNLDAPPTFLLNAVRVLQTNHVRGKTKFPEYLSKIVSQLPHFACPGTEHDILFKHTYKHGSGATCVDCDKEEVIERMPRGESNATLHFGTIASGNQVMKDAETRDRLSKELGGILCFEMEAAGLMNDFSCLVVRGICDYADSHKNNEWQPYAAATASACAKELLSIIPRYHQGKHFSETSLCSQLLTF